MNGGAGNDTFDINSSYSGNLTIDGKAGNDVVDLGDVSHETGTVYVEDTKGLVALTVNDVLDSQVRNPYIASNVITGFSPAFIWYEPTELASLTIDGTRGYIPFHRTGRFTTVPVVNVYNVLSTPGYNRYGQLVTTTLIANGAGGDTVGVLAVAIPGAKEKGIVGTLSIVSPLRNTALSIYGAAPIQPTGNAAVQTQSILTTAGITGGIRAAVTAFQQLQSTGSALVKSIGQAARSGFIPPAASISSVGTRFTPVIIDSGRVSGLAPGDIEFESDELTSLKVVTPAGKNPVNIWGTPNQGAVGSVVTSVITDGHDTVYVGDGVSGLSRLKGTLVLTNSAGPSNLIVDASGATDGRSATISPGLIQGLAPADIKYATAEVSTISLTGGSGADTFGVVGTIPRNPVSIDGGGGADTVVGPNLANNWSVTSNDAGSVGDVSFTRIGSLSGGTRADVFTLRKNGGLSGRINGGRGVNTRSTSPAKPAMSSSTWPWAPRRESAWESPTSTTHQEAGETAYWSAMPGPTSSRAAPAVA